MSYFKRYMRNDMFAQTFSEAVDNQEDLAIYQNLLENIDNLSDTELDEAISVVKRGVQSKRAAFAGTSAMAIAKEKNPALFRQYTKYNLMRKALKAKIMRQYHAKAMANARKRHF